MILLFTVAFAAFFYRVAEYEGMSPLLWGLASVAVAAAVALLGLGTPALLLAQIGLFTVVWWYNGYRKRVGAEAEE